MDALPKKRNAGNTKARGKTKQELSEQNEELARMLNVNGTSGDDFWIRLTKNDKSPPHTPKKNGLNVYPGLCWNDDNPRGSLDYLVGRGWEILCLCWGFELVLLHNKAKTQMIWLHLPFCKAGPGQARPMEAVVMRNLLIQLSTMAVAWCERDTSRGQMNTSNYDATLAAYAYEHALTACHMHFMHAAACHKNVMTTETVLPLEQNDLSKPLQKRAFQINHLAIHRGLNIFRRLPNLSSIQVDSAWHKVNDILCQDGADKKTVVKRWVYLKKKIKPNSKLVQAINKSAPKKKNSGNPNARGKTKIDQASYMASLVTMKEIGAQGKCFWIRLGNNNCSLPEEDEKGGHKVFANLTHGGVENNLNRVDLSCPYKSAKVLTRGRNTPAVKSRNGGFVLCHLEPKKRTQP